MSSAERNRNLAEVVRNNLANQQDWTDLQTHAPTTIDPKTGPARTLLSGMPPRRLYVHPDEQTALLRAERALGGGQRLPQHAEHEWVLPMHLTETPTMALFARVFDGLTASPRPDTPATHDPAVAPWRGANRGKRLLLAIVQDDSSVVYYYMHDGIVKPRQN